LGCFGGESRIYRIFLRNKHLTAFEQTHNSVKNREEIVMKKGYRLAIIIVLLVSNMALVASAFAATENATSTNGISVGNANEQEANQVTPNQAHTTLTLHVLDGDANGPPLPGVAVIVYDAGGNIFDGITDSYGSLVIDGQPGAWQFTFAKEGYETINLNQDINESLAADIYLQRINPPQEQVALTIYVHDGNINGPLLPEVQVTGQDAAGNSFDQLTDSNGSVVINGQPGSWQFIFAKEGYETISLPHSVNETLEADAYLSRIEQPQEQVALTIRVHDGDFNGPLLPDAQVISQDAAGNSFDQLTDSNGSVVISGQPGLWQLTLAKEGYETISQTPNVNETLEADAYLPRIEQPQEQVALTIRVHDGDFNGPLLPDAQVIGQDAAGNSFDQLTDSNGSVVISGQPGLWQLTLAKEGYETISQTPNVNETLEADAYLPRIEQPQEQVAPSEPYQQPIQDGSVPATNI
jgi:protein-tyrosine phosphatase